MSNSLINAAAGMLLLITGFACSVIVARLLGPAANGTVAFALWVAATGSLVAELGTGILLLRLLPQLKTKGADAQERRGFAAYLALPVFVATTLLTALYALFCWKGGGIAWTDSTAGVAALTAVLLFIQSIGSFTKNYLIGEKRLGTFFVFTAITSTLQLGIVLVGALVAGTEGALLGYIAGQSVFFLYTLGILSTRRNKAGHSARALAATSLLLFFEFVITAVFLTRPELVFLQHFRDSQDVGYYAVALSLANLALQLPVQLTGSLIPFYAERHEASEGAGATDLFAAVVRSFSYITFPLCFGLAAVASPLVVTVFGAAFEPAGAVVAILAIGSPAYVFIQLTTQYLYSKDQVKDRLVISSIGAVLMVIGCLVAVPLWGIVGASSVRGLVFLAMSALLVSHIKLESGAGKLIVVVIKVALAAVACGIVALMVTRVMHGVPAIAAGIAAGALAYALVLRLLAAIPPEDATVIDGLQSRLPSGIGRVSRLLFGLIAPLPSASQASK
ncbi:oligosaccharide flippase family protein [Mesorhizobium sp. 1M-11]|uniref:lipopolysaccharide biosynthesis protein n=1 Tax=Mesorhizobium sp. 1M-11 TaxID=1529006 RepID=UPI000A501CFD|nr:oligosaccharide flippase family protein [Mesorhizobium sp. 1M-11]